MCDEAYASTEETLAALAVPEGADVPTLLQALAREQNARKRAECAAETQSDSVQLALDLLVREPDVTGFFRAFIQRVMEDSEAHACGVWLLSDDRSRCDLWMANIRGVYHAADQPGWETLALPRESMGAHLYRYEPGWTETTVYTARDPRLPEALHDFNETNGIAAVVVAPLALPTGTLGWVALASPQVESCEVGWRRTLVEAMARQATLALHHSRVAEQSRAEERAQAVLQERNRIARDIHDTLAQGFGAILMQLQAAQRAAGSTLSPVVAKALDTAVELARTHMIEARRSVGALRPQTDDTQDVAAALHRIAEMARRTSEVPVEVSVESLPPFVAGVEREILGIAQEALTNAVRHSRARRIALRAEGVRSVGFRLSVQDDGRGFAAERNQTGFGMTSMRERAERIGASLTIVTAPRAGTEVVLAWEPPSFPVPGQDHAAR
jgi:signal transduction histidine kinase